MLFSEYGNALLSAQCIRRSEITNGNSFDVVVGLTTNACMQHFGCTDSQPMSYTKAYSQMAKHGKQCTLVTYKLYHC